jgi:hypothetical protein
MADDDPPPNVNRTQPDGIDPAVLTFLDVMKNTDIGTKPIDAVGRKLFTYKVSLHLSVDDPSAVNAVRNAFAKWLNELSKFGDLKGSNLQVTNCNDEFMMKSSKH